MLALAKAGLMDSSCLYPRAHGVLEQELLSVSQSGTNVCETGFKLAGLDAGSEVWNYEALSAA